MGVELDVKCKISVLNVMGNVCLVSNTLKQSCPNRTFCDDGNSFFFLTRAVQNSRHRLLGAAE